MELEVPEDQCFLCAPDPKLVYSQDLNAFALCGLGPIIPGYSVVAPRKHIPSGADVGGAELDKFLEFTLGVRRKLSRLYGSCLMTEHGRLPVCVDVSGTTDPHCFHAHFLLFPGAPTVEQQAVEAFAKVDKFESLTEALRAASSYDEYFLLSPSEDNFMVMARPGKLMRQFARYLVADALGQPELANWRRYPLEETAKSVAGHLRSKFQREE